MYLSYFKYLRTPEKHKEEKLCLIIRSCCFFKPMCPVFILFFLIQQAIYLLASQNAVFWNINSGLDLLYYIKSKASGIVIQSNGNNFPCMEKMWMQWPDPTPIKLQWELDWAQDRIKCVSYSLLGYSVSSPVIKFALPWMDLKKTFPPTTLTSCSCPSLLHQCWKVSALCVWHPQALLMCLIV